MRTLLILTAVLLQPVLSQGQTVGAPATAAPVAKGPVSAVLLKDVDAKRAKAGTAVSARLYSGFAAADGTRIPPGSMLIGHVAESSALGRGSIESRLAVIFDQAQLSSGQTVALHLGIAGLAAAPQAEAPVMQTDMGGDLMAPTPGGQLGGQTGSRTDRNPINGDIMGDVGPRGSRGSAAKVTKIAPLDGLSSKTPDQMQRGSRSAGVASVGSTVPGIALKANESTGSVLVSTSDTIVLRTGTPLVLMAVTETAAH